MCIYHYTHIQYYTDNPLKRERDCRSVEIYRKNDRPTVTNYAENFFIMSLTDE